MTKNSQGPSLVPCSTPAGTVFHSEKKASLSLTLCLRSVIKSNIQSRVVVGIAYFARLLSRRSIISKSFDPKVKKDYSVCGAAGVCAFVPGI